MPRKARKPCKHPGCSRLTEGAYCDEHKLLHPDRPSAAKRGHGSRWQRVSKAYLRKYPLCVKCLAEGRFVSVTVVDHIIPHRDNQSLMWSDTNWQALCKPCPRPQDRQLGQKSRILLLNNPFRLTYNIFRRNFTESLDFSPKFVYN